MATTTLRLYTLDHDQNKTQFRDLESIFEENDQKTDIYCLLMLEKKAVYSFCCTNVKLKQYLAFYANRFLAMFAQRTTEFDVLTHVIVWTKERKGFVIFPVKASAQYVQLSACSICLDNRTFRNPEFDILPCHHEAHVVCMKFLARQKIDEMDPLRSFGYNACATCEAEKQGDVIRLSISFEDFCTGPYAESMEMFREMITNHNDKFLREMKEENEAKYNESKSMIDMICNQQKQNPKSTTINNKNKKKKKTKNKKKTNHNKFTLTKDKPKSLLSMT